MHFEFYVEKLLLYRFKVNVHGELGNAIKK